MATVTITTTTAQDNAVKRAAQEYNATLSAADQLTPAQYGLKILTAILDHLVDKYSTLDGDTKAQLYMRASDADKATIDAILQKYAS